MGKLRLTKAPASDPDGERPPRAEAVHILEAWLEGLSQRTPFVCVCACVRAEFDIYVSEAS